MASVKSDVSRHRTPRHEAEQNILRATLELLAEKDPDQITVREIAERSGHNHRFVKEWFGGKTRLFAKAFEELNLHLAERLDFNRPTSEIPDPGVAQVVRLMNWLVANDPGSISRDRMRPVLNRLQHMYEDRFGIDDYTSLLLAQRMMFLISGLVLFKDVVAAENHDLPRQVALEFEIARLLGTRPG